MTPNMANCTQKHGYMKNKCVVLELDIIKLIVFLEKSYDLSTYLIKSY